VTIEDLWQDYLQCCCPPELNETSEQINLQRLTFMAGVTSAIGSVWDRPESLEELRDSIAGWIASEEAQSN
jgi:hypothetical protein